VTCRADGAAPREQAERTATDATAARKATEAVRAQRTLAACWYPVLRAAAEKTKAAADATAAAEAKQEVRAFLACFHSHGISPGKSLSKVAYLK
jgi:hypothetical protein